MAAPQSSRSCAPTGLLLLLIGVISTNLPEVHTKPIDFWCIGSPRNKTMEKIDNMAAQAQVSCTGLDVLPSPMQLPSTLINAEWRNKSAQEKLIDVLEALQVFQHGVQHLKNESSLQCQTSVLEDLERSITHLVNIVSQAHIQDEKAAIHHPAGKISGSVTSFREMVERYKVLLKGKLNYLAVDLCLAMTQDAKGKSS